MVYGVLKLINFAHGDVYMVGAFAGFYLSQALGVDQHPTIGKALTVLVGAMAICGILGVAIERFAYRPLRPRPRLTALITAIGVSLFLEYFFQLPGFIGPASAPFPPGPTPRFFPQLLDFGSTIGSVSIGELNIQYWDIVSFAVALAFMLALQWIVYRTRFGTSMRAVSFDSQVAGLMGINVNRVISGTFLLGSTLAAVAAILVASSRPSINPLMGLMPGIKAFVAAVFGGIGNVPGAMVGGLVLGLAEEYVAGYALSSYRDGIAFALLILVLLFRPAGLFGTFRPEKV
jgi:branched-chain amino acid transport system permease protein